MNKQRQKYLTPADLYATVVELSYSQGFYGRLRREMEDNWNAWAEKLTNRFTDDLDFILWLEQ